MSPVVLAPRAALQVAMVSAILTAKCGPSLAALTFGTLAAYIAFTFSVTQARRFFARRPGLSPSPRPALLAPRPSSSCACYRQLSLHSSNLRSPAPTVPHP